MLNLDEGALADLGCGSPGKETWRCFLRACKASLRLYFPPTSTLSQALDSPVPQQDWESLPGVPLKATWYLKLGTWDQGKEEGSEKDSCLFMQINCSEKPGARTKPAESTLVLNFPGTDGQREFYLQVSDKT